MTTETFDPPRSEAQRQRRHVLWLIGASVVAVIAIVAVVLASNGDDGGDASLLEPDLQLSLAGSDSLASCLPLEAEIMADMEMAFAATAVAVDGQVITLDVDRWYKGGDAEVVALVAEHTEASLIAAFPFEVGQEYLVTAANGTVNFCGYSGPATPELRAVFDQAFPG